MMVALELWACACLEHVGGPVRTTSARRRWEWLPRGGFGLRDPRRYIEAVAPTMFVPSHHDNWLPGVTAGAAAYDPPLLGELARIPAAARPELRSLHDPADYLRPELLTFAL